MRLRPGLGEKEGLRARELATVTRVVDAMFTEGDQIEARYKGSRKFYPGKIAAVNSDVGQGQTDRLRVGPPEPVA